MTDRLRRALKGIHAPRLGDVSLVSRLSVLVLLVTITSLVVASVVSLTYGESLADGLVRNRLITQLSLKSERVERYLTGMERAVLTLGESPVTVEAVTRFTTAYDEIVGAMAGKTEATEQVTAFYRDEFAPSVEAALGPATSWSALLPVEPAALYLQDRYVAGTPPDERALIDDAGDGTDWSSVHAEVHPAFREIAVRLGASDIYLVDTRGNVVYSVAKAPDFGTSLETGPYSGSTLGAVARGLRNAAEATTEITDVAPYLADAGSPSQFVATPIFDGDTLVGALAVKLDGGELDAIMTASGDWQSEGFGRSGEAFLVGVDGTMRSVSRLFLEDENAYLEAVTAADTASGVQLKAMLETGTTATFQRVIDPTTLDEVSQEPTISTDYLGREVYVAYGPVEIEGLGWQVAAEMERGEVEGPISAFRRALLIAVAVFVVAITFATVGWSRRVFAPIRRVSERLRRARAGEDWDVGEVDPSAPREFVALGEAIDSMLAVSIRRHEQLAAAGSERVATMRSILPPAVADRVRSGDRKILDDVPQATIVVVTLAGIGSLVEADGAVEARRKITALMEELDRLADVHGLEPVKLIGDSYFAGCGLNRPYLDQVPRAVAFALAGVEATSDVDDSGILGASAGVATGSVTVGLTGSTRLVYDLWGSTVSTATLIARAAAVGQVLVSDDVTSALPDQFEVRSVEGRDILAGTVFGVRQRVAEQVDGHD